MNDAQWLWCYLNILKDEEEEEEKWKSRLDYLGWYIDEEKAISVMKERELEEGFNNQYETKDVIDSGDQFELELKAAELGYDPNSGISIEEFLNNYYSQNKGKEKENLNTEYFELPTGDFVGNRESQEDFISRVMNFKDYAINSFNHNNYNNDINENDINENDINLNNQNKMIMQSLLEEDDNDNQINEDELQKILRENGLTIDDLDIINVYDPEDEEE